MGVFKDIINIFAKSKDKNKVAKDIDSQKMESLRADKAVEISNIPDFPVKFGYKTGWLAIRANSPDEVINKLGLENPQVANWETGIKSAYSGEYLFVSPCINGFVLILEVITLGDCLEKLEEIAQKFKEVHYFCTHRVSEYHLWIKYINGKMTRGYCWCGDEGEVSLNKGELTEEEKNLGLENLITDAENDDWDTCTFAEEQHVLDIAASWGVDTMFRNEPQEKSTGFVCDFNPDIFLE